MPDEKPQQEPDGTDEPARKRKNAAALVPFTVMVEPGDLATVEAIARASGRTMGDVMREALSHGMGHMLEKAFGPDDAQEDEPPADAIEPEHKPSRRRKVVSAAIDPDALAVLSAMAGEERGARSDVLRRAIAEGLAVAEGSADE